jgi:S1-C subfamily serine protease
MQKLSLAVIILAVVSAILMICGDTFAAQPDGNPEPKTMVFKKGDVFLLSELGAVIKNDSGDVKIEFLLPEDKRDKEYQTVDLEGGDVILMMNGKKIKSVTDLEDNYALIPVGDDIKLGVNRNGSMMIVSFPKGEEQSSEGPRMMIVQNWDEEGEEPSASAPSVKILSMKDGKKSILLSDPGILVQEKDDGLYVLEVLPDADNSIPTAGIKGGEKLVSIQGTKVNTIDELSKIYDDIPAGDMVGMSFEEDGNQLAIKFTKGSQETKSIIIKHE